MSEYVNLESYRVRVAPVQQKDEIHPALQMSVVFLSKSESIEAAEICLKVATAVPSGTLLLRSPFAVVLSIADGEPRCQADYSVAMIGCLGSSGYLSRSFPNYRADLKQLLQWLYPRAESACATREELELLYLQKIERNAFEGLRGSCLSLLRLGSFLNHSCAPNCHLNWDYALSEATFYAIRPLLAGEEITISYYRWPVDCWEFRSRAMPFECACKACLEKLAPSLDILLCDWLPRLDDHCWWCGANADSRCSACMRAAYCGPGCQLADRPMHRMVCKKLSKLPTEPPAIVQPTLKAVSFTDSGIASE